MREPDQAEFTEKIDRPILSHAAVRGGIVLGSALLFAVGVLSVMGASPSPSTGTDPSTGATPSAGASTAPASPDTTNPTNPNVAPDGGMHMGMGPGFMRGFGMGVGDGPGLGFGGVTITAIDGSNLSLKTDDGWTRTITVTADTTITRAGTTIAVGDLKVGDQIVFSETRQSDGTYTITDIHLVLPTVAGKITKIDGSTITVQRFDGTTQVLHVDDSTTYRVAGSTTATLKDLAVGDVIVAQGTQRSDGSLDAESVAGGQTPSFDGDGGHFRFPGWPGDKGPDGTSPSASPAPSANAG